MRWNSSGVVPACAAPASRSSPSVAAGGDGAAGRPRWRRGTAGPAARPGWRGARARMRSRMKIELGIGGLLHPERAVIVEDGDARRRRHEIRRALGRDGGDEVQQRPPRRAVAPGGQRVGARACARCRDGAAGVAARRPPKGAAAWMRGRGDHAVHPVESAGGRPGGGARRPRRSPPPRRMAAAAGMPVRSASRGALAQLRHRVAQAEAAGALARREVAEGLAGTARRRPARGRRRRRAPPASAVVEGSRPRARRGRHAQVEQLRHAQRA